MIVAYTPDGQPPQRFEFKSGKVRALQAEAIEKAWDGTYKSWAEALTEGNVRARRILLWHLLRGQHPALKLTDVDFGLGELSIDFDPEELRQLRERLAELQPDDEAEAAELQKILAQLDEEIGKDEDGESGKANESSAVTP